MMSFSGDSAVSISAAATLELDASEREQRRAKEMLRIERAALYLLLERGFDDVTAEEIAAAASISRRTFFRYFPSRDDVLCGVYVRALRQVFNELCARPVEEAPIEALVNAARIDLTVSADPDEREIAKLSRQLMASDSTAWRRAVAQAQSAILENFTDVVAYRLRMAGRNPEGARIISASLWAVSCEVFFEWLKGGGRGSLPDRLLDGLQTLRDALVHQPS